MKKPEYAADRYAVVNIALSVLIMGSAVGYEIYRGNFTVGSTIRAFLVPAICIWIPDIIEGLNDNYLSSKSIRKVGWVLLFIVVVFPLILRSLFWPA